MNNSVDFKGKDGTKTTKEEERAALAKIIKIIEGLGEGSYLDWAFDGIIDLAEKNIGNDSAESMREALEAERSRHEKTRRELADYEKTIKYWENRHEIICQRRDELLAEQDDWSDLVTKLNNEITELKADKIELAQDNLELKAKLYDMITKEEKR